ncbi:MAG: DNA glycosylase [Microbacterium sp.]|nr:DNA glycosylase [Microbacterium sp.]|tara:strand:- start:1094 stop:1867 length:774 start_codon:yes stop_codon:yes gene_type:complete
MPEGDTVFRAARRLADVLEGRELARFDLRVPRVANVDLTGGTVREVVPRGKHLLHRIDGWTLHTHLKMEGEWHVYDRGGRWRKPGHKARAVLGTLTHDTVGFDLADIAVVPTDQEDTLVGHLGPDPLSPAWDAGEAARRLSVDTRSIHVALLDQRNVAGFGNEYANEILFVRGVLPTTPAPEVDTPALLDLGARMIRANRDRAGRTFTGDTRPGRSTWVYRREGRACRRCGTLIEGGQMGADPTSERITFWCPRCQT